MCHDKDISKMSFIKPESKILSEFKISQKSFDKDFINSIVGKEFANALIHSISSYSNGHQKQIIINMIARHYKHWGYVEGDEFIETLTKYANKIDLKINFIYE